MSREYVGVKQTQFPPLTRDRQPLEEPGCETKPMGICTAEAAAERVRSVPARAYCDTGILPVLQETHGQDAHATKERLTA